MQRRLRFDWSRAITARNDYHITLTHRRQRRQYATTIAKRYEIRGLTVMNHLLTDDDPNHAHQPFIGLIVK